MGAKSQRPNDYLAGVDAGAVIGAGCCVGGNDVGCGPDWMMLSCERSPRGKTTRLMNNASTMNTVARIVVVLVRKSEVLRTPNTVPRLLVPKVPASPPPLLACMRTTIINNMLTIISITIKNVYISLPLRQTKTPTSLGF
jgi:hypothetical protein